MGILAAVLLAGVQEWEVLDRSKWEANEGWKEEEGTMARVAKGGNLWSREEFGDFVLRLEFKVPPGGNSGVHFRGRDNVEHQVEILADAGGRPQSGSSGSVFRRVAPSRNMARPAGEWNEMELEVRGRAVSVTYNGEKVISGAIVDDLPFRGSIGLQDHGTPLWFRNIRVRRLGPPPAPASPDPTAQETRDFMMKLARYVHENHLKKAPGSEQRGMIYEYFDVTRKGEFDQWVQGEALDTMHDGAWFAAALVNAARATGDPFYREFLAEWVLPFYLRMLNHSDTLFSAKEDHSGDKAHKFGKEHRLQEGEKGFVPYFWDDGASVSLERRKGKTSGAPFACTDRLAGKPNPQARLDGWSHGCSNHMAQDLAVMLQLAWLLLREGDPKRAAEAAEAARNLHESRMRHHGPIPACVAAAALAKGDAELLKRVPPPREGAPSNHYSRCLAPPDPARPQATPGFADDDQYQYYSGIARAGGSLPRPLALALVYDAFTHPMLFRYHSDNAEVAPGINRFDLHGLSFKGGKPAPYRSERPVPTGSRFGPQNMVVCGWGLQALKAHPGLWEESARGVEGDLRVRFIDEGRSFRVEARPEPGASEPISLGAATLRLASHRNALLVHGEAKGDAVAVRIHARPDGKGTWAEATVRRDRTWEARNDAGEPFRIAALVLPAAEGFAFEIALPYTVARDQKPWANPVELGRYSISVGEARRNFVLASTEEQVVRALRRELAGGLRTWMKIFEEKGFIPTGIGAGGDWDRFSDSGGAAHLLSAAAQYLLYLEGKRDWEVHGVPAVLPR